MADFDDKAVSAAMRARRQRKIIVRSDHREANAGTKESLDTADLLIDLIETIVALQSGDVAMIKGLAQGLWEGALADRHLFMTNMRAVMDAVAGH